MAFSQGISKRSIFICIKHILMFLWIVHSTGCSTVAKELDSYFGDLGLIANWVLAGLEPDDHAFWSLLCKTP